MERQRTLTPKSAKPNLKNKSGHPRCRQSQPRYQSKEEESTNSFLCSKVEHMATLNKNIRNEDWVPVGDFATVTEAARCIVDLEALPKNGLFLEFYVETS